MQTNPARPLEMLVLDHLLILDKSHGHSSGLNVVDVVKHLTISVSPIEYLAHCLEGSRSALTRLESVTSSKVDHLELPIPNSSTLLTYLAGVIHTIVRYRHHKFDVCVAVNPVNFLSGYMLRMLGVTKLVVFYSADYSPTRSQSKYLNYAYQLVDRFAARHSDASWNVSKQICLIRTQQGAKHVHHVPNAPRLSLFQLGKLAVRKPFSLVYTFPKFSGDIVHKNHMLRWLIDNFSALRQDLPLVRLRLIGLGNIRGAIEPLVTTKSDLEHIDFMDVRERDTLIQLLCESSIGLALYDLSGGASHLAYGDSMKLREYLAAGLPVITTPGHPMANEINEHKLGYVISTEQSFVDAVRAIYSNLELHEQLRERAIRYSHENDISIILSLALQNLYIAP